MIQISQISLQQRRTSLRDSTGLLIADPWCVPWALSITLPSTILQDRANSRGLTARTLSLPYSNERSASAEETRRRTTSLLYAAAHPVSKRNMLFVLDDKVKNLSAAWVPGVPRPAQGCADQFLSVRVGGVPAGVHKIYVTLEACYKIANRGLLCAMPGATVVGSLVIRWCIFTHCSPWQYTGIVSGFHQCSG